MDYLRHIVLTGATEEIEVAVEAMQKGMAGLQDEN